MEIVLQQKREYFLGIVLPVIPTTYCIFRTTAWTLHPNYDNTDFEKGNDIAVIDIRGQGLTLSDTVKPVCKPTVRPVLNDILTIMGWGITEAGTVSPVLKRARKYKIA